MSHTLQSVVERPLTAVNDLWKNSGGYAPWQISIAPIREKPVTGSERRRLAVTC